MLHPAYPEGLVEKKQYLASGVVAAFECKLTLRARDFPKIARTARAVRAMAARETGDTLYSALHDPIVYGVLAHSSEWSDPEGYALNGDYRDPAAVMRVDRLLADALAGDGHPREALDAVCIADLACWWRMVAAFSPAGWSPDLWESARRAHGWPEEGLVHD